MSVMPTQNNMSSDSQGISTQHSYGIPDKSSVHTTPSFDANSLPLYGNCVVKVGHRRDTFLTQNAHSESSELKRHGNLCDDDRSTFQSTNEESNFGLFTSADLKENTNSQCDLADELFHSELDMKHEDITQEEIVTPAGKNCSSTNKRETQYRYCVIKIKRCDDKTFLTRNTHSSELDRPGYPSDGDGNNSQGTSEETNLSLFASAGAKRQNTGTECDLLDKRFHYELDMKLEDPHQGKRATLDSVSTTSNYNRNTQYNNSMIKVEPCDDETFLIQNTHSVEADRHGYTCDGDGNTCQETSKETSFGLFASTSEKRENTGSKCDLPDALFHSELALKLENVTQEERVTPDVASLISNNAETLHSGCVIKVEPHDYETFLTQNAHSSELGRHGDLCDSDRITCQRTREQKNLGLLASASVKRENTGAECDLPDERNSEMELKLEKVTEEERVTPNVASLSSNTKAETLHSGCVIKVEPRDDDSEGTRSLTQKAYSTELDRHVDICDGDRITCQRTDGETNIGLFTSTSVKRENTGVDYDLPDELFHSELVLKLEDIPQEERVTPGSASVSAVNKGETLAGDGHITNCVRQGSGAWSPVATVSDGSSLFLLQTSGCVETKAHSKPELLAANTSANVFENKQGKDLRRTSKNVCPKCCKLFCRASELQNHMRIHIGLRQYNNMTCGRKENRECNLKKHRNNLGIKRHYKCNECAYCAVSKSHLVDHIRIHTGEKPFKCTECDYSTAVGRRLITHTRIHTGDNPFHCTVCDYNTADKRRLITHTRIHTGEKPFKCTECHYSTADKGRLKRHTRIHTGEKPFKCGQCDYVTADKYSLNNHTRIHTGSKPYKCSECNYSAALRNNLLRHFRIHTREKPFECGERDYDAADKGSLHKHTLIDRGEKPFKCNECDYSAAQKSHLIVHIRIHTGEKPFKCSECEYRTAARHSLTKHTRIHTGKPFKCGECDYSAAIKDTLIKHIRIHTGEKPFKCTECDYGAAQKIHLITHIRSHTGEKPFKCAECEYGTADRQNLKRHTIIHTGKKPFKCGECDYSAAVKSSLITHIRIHNGEKPFQCTVCDYSTTDKRRLITHTRIHTGEKPFQ